MYSEGFRVAALRVYATVGSLRATVALVGASIASISRWATRSTPLLRRPMPSRITEQIVAFLRITLARQPHLSAARCAAAIRHAFDISVSRQLVQVAIRKAGISYKRIRKRGISPATLELSPAFASSFVDAFQAGTLAAVDESGFDQRPNRGMKPASAIVRKLRANHDRKAPRPRRAGISEHSVAADAQVGRRTTAGLPVAGGLEAVLAILRRMARDC
jgi:transposase